VAYIGTAPTAGQYRKLDSISSSFNGSTTTFTTQVGGQNVSAGTPSQLLVSLGGVIQQPTTDYTVSTNSLTFVTAPASGLSFFAILMGDALSVGTPADGTVSTAKLADAAVTTAKLASGLTVDLTSGSAAAPSLTFDANTGLYSPAEDEIGFVEGGVEAARIDSSGRLLVGTSTATANGGVVQVSNGITFPATQSACSDVNTLDDYEEGTWTPNLENTSGIGLGSAYNTRTGAYTKIGNVVYWNAYVDVATNNASCTGNMRISGFPYSIKGVSSNVGGFYIGHLDRVGTNLRGTTVLTATNASSTTLDLFYLNSSGQMVRVQGGSDFVNPIILMAGFYYF